MLLLQTASQVTVDGSVTNTSGLTLAVTAFRLGDFSYPGGTIAAVASKTQWLCVNIRTGLLHTLPRNLDQGVVYLARVVAGASTITTLSPIPPRLPLTRIPKFLTKAQASEVATVNVLGNSLEANGSVAVYGWLSLLFSSGRNVATYAMPSDAHTLTNYAVGGTSANWTFACLGRGCVAANATYNTTIGVRAAQNEESPLITLANIVPLAKPVGNSIHWGKDLLVIGCIANPIVGSDSIMEGICRLIASRGQEALMVSDNNSSTDLDADPNWVSGFTLAKLCDRYGIQFADTAAYVREMVWRGTSPYVDTIHMNNTYGHPAWAECVAGAIAHTVRMESTGARPDALITPLSATSWIPGSSWAEVGLVGAQSGGSLETGLAAGTNRLAQAMGLTDTTRYNYTTGQYVCLGHPLLLALYIAVDANTAFTANVRSNGVAGTIVSTISWSTPNANPVAFLPVYLASDVGGVWGSNCYTIEVTSGTMRFYGVAYQAPKYTTITDTLRTFGTWAVVSNGITANVGRASYTDTISDVAMVKAASAVSFAATFVSTSSAGIITPNIDGGDLGTTDLYVGVGIYLGLVKFAPSISRAGPRELTLKYTGNNASIAAASGSARRMSIVQVFAIEDR